MWCSHLLSPMHQLIMHCVYFVYISLLCCTAAYPATQQCQTPRCFTLQCMSAGDSGVTRTKKKERQHKIWGTGLVHGQVGCDTLGLFFSSVLSPPALCTAQILTHYYCLVATNKMLLSSAAISSLPMNWPPLQFSVDIRVMVMKGHFTFPKHKVLSLIILCNLMSYQRHFPCFWVQTIHILDT